MFASSAFLCDGPTEEDRLKACPTVFGELIQEELIVKHCTNCNKVKNWGRRVAVDQKKQCFEIKCLCGFVWKPSEVLETFSWRWCLDYETPFTTVWLDSPLCEALAGFSEDGCAALGPSPLEPLAVGGAGCGLCSAMGSTTSFVFLGSFLGSCRL